MINFYTAIHFTQYLILGRYLIKNWWLFLVISIGWELIELVLPFQIALETFHNKLADIVFNCLGFYSGIALRK
jgi:hypothetical protein